MSDDFNFSANFDDAVKAFKALTTANDAQSKKLEELVKSVNKYNVSQDKLQDGLEASAKAAKKFGLEINIGIKPETQKSLNKYLDTLGQIKKEVTEIKRVGSPFEGVGAASFEGKRKRRNNSPGQAVEDLFGLLTAPKSRITGAEALVQLRTREFQESKGRDRLSADIRNRTAVYEGLQLDAQKASAELAKQALVALKKKVFYTEKLNKDLVIAADIQEHTNKIAKDAADRQTYIRNRVEGRKALDTFNAANPKLATGGIDLVDSARYFATYRALSAVRNGFADASEAALKFSKTLTQIQTITLNSGKSFDQLKEQILAVSNIFGQPVEDVAEATYLAISNQVVDAGNSFHFLAESAQFARATASSLTDAVNLGSSVLNSYGLSADQANSVFSKFFKTIEIGRIRADEISNSIGTVTTLAAPLGISIEEVGAALATLTLNGVTANNAMTFLRNLLVKIVKPTQEMTDFIHGLGYATGQAAIQAEGFSGFLDKIFKEVDGNTSKAAELVSNIRAIQAEMGLAKEGSLSFANTLAKTKSAFEDYDTKVKQIVEDSAATNIAKQLNEVRNSLVNMAVDGLKSLDALAPKGHLIQLLIDGLTVSVGALTVAYVANSIAAANAAKTTTQFGLALNTLKAHPVILLLSALAGVYFYTKQQQEQFSDDVKKLTSDTLTDYTNKLNKDVAPALDAVSRHYGDMAKETAQDYKKIEASYQSQKGLVEQLKDAVIRSFEEQTSSLKSELSKQESLIKQQETAIKKSQEKKLEEKNSQRREDFEKELEGLSDLEKANKLRVESEINQNRAKKLAQTGEIEAARKLSEFAIKDAEQAKKLDPGQAKFDSINTNVLLRERDRATRDLNRLEGFINHLGGDNRVDADTRRVALLEKIDELNQKITVSRGTPRLGRPDDADIRVTKAKKTQIEIETDYQSALHITNVTLENQNKLLEDHVKVLNKDRDAFGDWLTAIKKADPKQLSRVLENLPKSTGISASAIQELRDKGIIPEIGIEKQRDQVTRKQIRLGEQSEAQKKALGLFNTSKEQLRAADLEAITRLASIDDSNIANPTVERLIRTSQDKARRGLRLRQSGQEEAAAQVLTLTPEERKIAVTAFSRETESSRLEPFKGFESDLKTLNEVQKTLIKATNESSKTYKEAIELLIGTILHLPNLPKGDSMASGGYSYTGGVHHPGEYIINAKQTRMYKPLLEMLNQDTESYIKTENQAYDPLGALSPFAKLFDSGHPIFDSKFVNPVTRNSEITTIGGRFNGLVGGFGDKYSGATLSGDELLSGLRSRLTQQSGLDFTGLGNTNFSLSPRILNGSSGTQKSFQIGDINITISSPTDSRGIADNIRRDLERNLSSLG